MIEASELKQVLESVLETAVDGIINIDTKGHIININKAALELFEYEKGELLNQKVNILMESHDANHHDTYVSNYLSTRKPKIIGIGREVIGKTKNGKLFPFRLAVSEVILNDKVIFTGIIHDLTEIKKSIEDLENLNKELDQKVLERTNEIEKVINQLLSTNDKLEGEIKEKIKTENILIEKENELQMALQAEKELGELKSRFVSTASHEFRTPLATILSSVVIIQKYVKEEDQDKRETHVSRIKNAVTHLTSLLDDFLSLAKLEENKINTDKTEFTIFSLVNEVIDSLSVLTKDTRNIMLSIDENIKVISDKNILRNVLFNVLSNAIKYSKGDVVITHQVHRESVTLSIKDDGIGIPLDDQKHIFSRFYRASNVGNQQGTGLGLNIVKKYCDLIGAHISFISSSDKGTTFFINIPTTKNINIT